MDTLSGEATLSFYFCLPPEWKSTLKGKNLLLQSFLNELPFIVEDFRRPGKQTVS